MKECHECGAKRKRIAQHWTMGSCNPPELTDRQCNIITGLALGDGSIMRPTKTPRVQVNSREKDFLSFLHQEFGVFSAMAPHKRDSAEELAKADRESGFHKGAKADNYRDKYQWQSICSEVFEPWREWYSSGSIVWPGDVELKPLTMSVWYASDASYDPNHGRGRVMIDTANEKDNKEKVLSYFDSIPVETPQWDEYNEYSTIRFTADGTEQLLEYMDEIIPGYEYKWGIYDD